MFIEWFSQLWHRIRGNLEAYLVLALLGGAMTAFTILTHGLTWWQQAILVGIFLCVFIWAIMATLSKRSTRPPMEPTGLLGSDTMTESDPRVYLRDIFIGGDGMFPETPFVVENIGGAVAHQVQIQTMVFGFMHVDFVRIGHLPVGEKQEILPCVRASDVGGKRSILTVLRDAWNDKGKAEDTILPNFAFTVVITYANFKGDRQMETTVNMTYSYTQQLMRERYGDRLPVHKHPIFETQSTNFRLIPSGTK